MVIEAEWKARVSDPEYVQQHLAGYAPGRVEIYQDTYYDDPSGGLAAQDRELRVRTVHQPDQGTAYAVLTYKGASVDEASGSKPEHQTRVADPDAVHAILRGLGYLPSIAFDKHCRNYEFEERGRRMLASLVRVPGLDGTFLELETPAEESELQLALDDIRAVLHDLGIADDDLTTEQYTDALAARSAAPHAPRVRP